MFHSLDRHNSFDLLRLIAAGTVVYSHALRIFDLGPDPTLSVFPKDDLSSFGVMMFFAISGYLVARSAANTRSLRRFALKRVLRIFPALIICLVVTVLLIGPIATMDPLSNYLTNWLTHKYFLNVLLFPLQADLPGVFPENPWQNNVNGSLWTLSSEFLAYVLVALVFAFGGRRITAFLISSVALLLFAFYTYQFTIDGFPLIYILQTYGTEDEYFSGCIITGYMEHASYACFPSPP